MEFLKIYADMEPYFEVFTAEELGNLFAAMMRYAFHGEQTEFQVGNERFLWPVLKRHVDQCAGVAEKMSDLGKRSGRTRQTPVREVPNDRSKKSNDRSNSVIEIRTPVDQEQEQEQEHIQEQEQEQMEYDAHARVTGIDGSDLTEAIRAQDTADAMILRYNLPHDIPTREKLLEDLMTHGEARMREVLEKACESNTRDRVTSAYWRAILANAGKGKPKAATAQQGYQVRDYQTPDFHRMEVDVEAEAEALGVI